MLQLLLLLSYKSKTANEQLQFIPLSKDHYFIALYTVVAANSVYGLFELAFNTYKFL